MHSKFNCLSKTTMIIGESSSKLLLAHKIGEIVEKGNTEPSWELVEKGNTEPKDDGSLSQIGRGDLRGKKKRAFLSFFL